MVRTIVVLGVVACSGKPVDPPGLLDTGWFDDSTLTGACTDVFVAWSPDDGAEDWYWRDRPQAFTQTDRIARYDSWLLDGEANRVDTTLDWAEGNLSFEHTWDGYLEANTDYTMVLQDCIDSREISFHTSALGAPLEDEAVALAGNTYLLDVAGADWVEPAIFGPIIAYYLTEPILLGVRLADGEVIDLIGAPGKTDLFGKVTQDDLAPSWDFPIADFSEQPFLDAQAALVTLQYSLGEVVDIPVSDFVLQATFSADATTLSHGVISGVADTRYLGDALESGNGAAMCELASGFGVSCIPCTDGEPLCLDMRAENLEGTLQVGLVLVER